MSGFQRATWFVVLKGTMGVMQESPKRYNPLIDLTAEERIEATVRRVSLGVPEMARGGRRLPMTTNPAFPHIPDAALQGTYIPEEYSCYGFFLTSIP